MAQVGLLAAFLGGALTLVSPCSALLLPSFFAYAFARPRDLLARTAVFWVGLSSTLVPLGVGSAAVSSLFYGHRGALITGAGWLIIAMGIVQLLGGGFAVPGVDRLRGRIAGRSQGWVGTFLLGAVYGLAGFCAGPVLGSVLTMAAAGGDVVGGGLLLADYALGMAAPLFLLALLWDRLQLGRRRWLRGRPVRVGRWEVSSNQVISGVLFVVIGWLFLAFDGTAAIVGVDGVWDTTDLEFGVQNWLTGLSGWLDLGLLVVVAMALLAVIMLRLRRVRTAHGSGGTVGNDVPTGEGAG